MRKHVKMFLGIGLAISLLATSACSKAPKNDTAQSSKEETKQAVETTKAEKPDPFEKMPELVEFTTGKALALDPKIPEGETLDDNELVKFIQDKMNVKQKIIWTTSDQNNAFEDKIKISIASSDIPDVLEFYSLPILKKLVDNEMIEDLTKVYEDYASPSFKEHHEAANNIGLATATFGGKLMALPNLSDTESIIQIMWLRQDWLDKLGLQGPKTVDDLAAIAKAFIERDPDGNGKADTLGILGSSALYNSTTASFDAIFNAHKSFPGTFIKDSSGNIVHGSTVPETRAALLKLQELYKAGLIDKEFALKDPGKATEDIVNGTAGILPGAWWSPWWPLNTSVQKDPTAEWRAYGIAADDGKYYAVGSPPASKFLVIKKGFKYPEAIIKANNLVQDAEFLLYDWYNAHKAADGKYSTLATQLWPTMILAKYSDEISRRWKIVKDGLDGVTKEEDLDSVARNIYNNIKINRENPKKQLDAWMFDTAWSSGADVFLKGKYEQAFPAFSGVTDTMAKKMTPMNDLEKDVFLKIIMNKLPIDEFDKFVTKWKEMGGAEITKEINELMK